MIQGLVQLKNKLCLSLQFLRMGACDSGTSAAGLSSHGQLRPSSGLWSARTSGHGSADTQPSRLPAGWQNSSENVQGLTPVIG